LQLDNTYMKHITYFLMCLPLSLSFTSMAQPGSLDLSFSGDGKLTTGFQLPSVVTNDYGKSVAIQTDGKIVMAGYFEVGTSPNRNREFAVVRYNSTGTLDNTFSGDGKVTTAIGTTEDEANAVAIQGDGKIIVAGFSFNGNNFDIALVRYNADGTLDNTFSQDGKLTTAIGMTSDYAYSIAVQANGKIVVAGSSDNATNSDFALVRYNADGTLDNTFSGDGKVVTPIGTGGDEAHALFVQVNGKISVAGYSNNGSNRDFALARYNADGTLDNTFSGDGKLTTAIGTSDDQASAIAIQGDGKIIAAGYSANGYNDFALARYNANGILDNTFSGDGKLTTAIGTGNDAASAAAIQGDGKIIAAGYTDNGSNYDFALIRYNADGTLDNTFSGDGKITTDFGTGNDIAYAVAIQVDAKIVAAGYSDNGSNADIALVRYNTDGALDNGFANDGKMSNEIGATDIAAGDRGRFVAVKSNGKIVVVGASFMFSTFIKTNLTIAQYNANGSIDNTFGFKGEVIGDFEGGDFTANAAAIQGNGKIVVGGYFYHGSKQDFALVRYNVNGTLDNTFSGDGFVNTTISLHGSDACNAVIIQPDGKILAGGTSSSCSTCATDFAVVRYNADGTMDNLFSVDGKLTTDFSTHQDVITSLALQQDGKIVAAGYTDNGSNNDFAVARYNANGDPDNTFSIDGKQTTGFISYNDFSRSVKIQADGKIVVGGYSGKSSVKDNDFALVRYNTNGTLDNTFSGDGKQTTTLDGTSEDYCSAITFGSGGTIIAGGYYLNTLNQHDFALVRYTSNGTPDNSFGTSGKITTDFANTDDYGGSITIGPNGKLVMAGYSNNDFAIARYNLVSALTISQATRSNITDQSSSIEVIPNPILSKAIISFSLDQDESVKINLFDAQGNKLRNIKDEKLLKGVHQVEFSKNGLKTGIYFLRVEKSSGVITKQLVIE
jgi:uncharacterized delta-60 repeat protein